MLSFLRLDLPGASASHTPTTGTARMGRFASWSTASGSARPQQKLPERLQVPASCTEGTRTEIGE